MIQLVSRTPAKRSPAAHGGPVLAAACLSVVCLLGACSAGTSRRAVPPPPGEPAVPTTPPPIVLDASTQFTVLGDSIGNDPDMEALVAPFRAQMGNRTGEVLGEAAGPFEKGWPEGSLGNFAADAILWGARRTGQDVDLAVANNGGLRIPLAQGPITAGKIFELMPFDNVVSVLTLSGRQLQDAADYIASRGGEPVAGFSFRMELVEGRRVARDVTVGGEPVEAGRLYRLATSDYLANGGDEFAVFDGAVDRIDLPLLIRDVFMDYIRTQGVIRPKLDGRITGSVRR